MSDKHLLDKFKGSADISGRDVAGLDGGVNVITLDSRRKQTCMHHSYVVDFEFDEITCTKCNEKFNPYSVVRDLAQRESRLKYRAEANQKILDQIDAKKRTICQHCKKMTTIRLRG